MKFWLLILGSFFCVAFGQPFWSSWAGIAASCIGFALFWKAMLELPERRRRFWLAVLWFASVQAVQISWMTSLQYMGGGILAVYAFLLFALGLQFGLLSLLLGEKSPLPLLRCLAISGSWVIFEWTRLFFLTGFPWNPVGLSLASSSYSIQFASLFGIYGLSFWVIWSNLSALNALHSIRWRIGWAASALIPYLFGVAQQTWVEYWVPPQKTLSVALVQTALLPEQKDWIPHRSPSFISPQMQWKRVFALFQKRKEPIDLIVFPEAALSQRAHRPIYPLTQARSIWQLYFGNTAALPSTVSQKVANAYFAQALSNQFRAHVIIGLDDEDEAGCCNAAFHFHPEGSAPERYEKQILMPIVEYIPLSEWHFLSEFIAQHYGIESSFFRGKETKLFSSKVPIGISICAEEIYSGLIRKIRSKGAEIFVTISNDVWFPRSRLPLHHFHHGRVRAAENGTYFFRSSNTGITGIIDCFGREVTSLAISEKTPEVLFASVSLRSFPTLYTFLGDGPIVSLSFLFFFFFWRKKLL